MNLHIIDAPLVFTAIIAGLISLVILGYPLVSYIKEFNRMQQTGKSFTEIFFKTLLMQFGILLVALSITTVWNTVVGEKTKFSSYSFKYGTALFYGYFDPKSGAMSKPIAENGEGFWTVWQDYGDLGYNKLVENTSIRNPSAGATKAIAASLVVINALTTLVWMCLFIFPPFCILFPIFLGVRKHQGSYESDNTIISRFSAHLVLMLALVVLGFIHSELASLFVEVQITQDFSFWETMQSIWTGILKKD